MCNKNGMIKYSKIKVSVILSFVLSVCLSVLKFGIMIQPTSQKNWLTVSSDPVPDTDSKSLYTLGEFIIAEQGILGDLLAFLIQSPSDFHETWLTR